MNKKNEKIVIVILSIAIVLVAILFGFSFYKAKKSDGSSSYQLKSKVVTDGNYGKYSDYEATEAPVDITANLTTAEPVATTEAPKEDAIKNTGDYKNKEVERMFPDISKKALDEKVVKTLNQKQIQYAINELYASKGRKFDDKKIQKHFNAQKWYKGKISAKKFDKKKDSILSKLEKANEKLLEKYRDQKGGN